MHRFLQEVQPRLRPYIRFLKQEYYNQEFLVKINTLIEFIEILLPNYSPKIYNENLSTTLELFIYYRYHRTNSYYVTSNNKLKQNVIKFMFPLILFLDNSMISLKSYPIPGPVVFII